MHACINIICIFFVLSDGRSELSLGDILQFWTGADSVPPCGFREPLTLAFYAQEEGIVRLPNCHTCAMILRLPRGAEDPEIFQKLLEFAIKGTQGFGKI